MKAFLQDRGQGSRAAERRPRRAEQELPDGRWDDVRVFLAAYRHRTLGVAAKKLALDTSTMSRRLTAFEAAIGTRLFDRSREGLSPTRAAEVVLAAAEAMEAAHARLSRDASDVEATAEGTVRLSVAPAMADHFIAPMLPKLHRQYPGIRLELEGSARPVDLTRHEADLALRSVPPVGAELIVTKLGSGRWVAAGSSSTVRRLGKLRAWDDALWIGWDRDMTSFAPERWLTKHVSAARVVLRTSLFTSQLIAAGSGLGLVLLPEPYLPSRKLRAAAYAPALADDAAAWPADSLWLAGHRAMRDVPRVAAVWKFLAEELRIGLPGAVA